jgi:hypothetical protein
MDEPHRLPFPSEQDVPWSAGACPSEYRIARPAPVSSTREKPDGQGIGLGHNGKQFRDRITTGAGSRSFEIAHQKAGDLSALRTQSQELRTTESSRTGTR